MRGKPTKAIIFFATTLRELCKSDHHLGYALMKRVTEVVINRLQSTRHQLLKCENAADAPDF